jgi:hypothetical protein
MFFRELFGDILHNQQIPLSMGPLLDAHNDCSYTEYQGHQRIQNFIAIFKTTIVFRSIIISFFRFML